MDEGVMGGKCSVANDKVYPVALSGDEVRLL